MYAKKDGEAVLFCCPRRENVPVVCSCAGFRRYWHSCCDGLFMDSSGLKFGWLVLLSLTGSLSLAQQRIYRCGNEYTNNPSPSQVKSCKLVEGGNVTVVQSTRPPGGGSAVPKPAASSTAKAVDSSSAEQKARDSDARAILEAELRKSEQRLQELQKEYNNGEPEKLGPEHKNHQKYLDRVAELKSSIERSQSDIAGIKREIARLTPR
jgi:hypothetical protein